MNQKQQKAYEFFQSELQTARKNLVYLNKVAKTMYKLGLYTEKEYQDSYGAGYYDDILKFTNFNKQLHDKRLLPWIKFFIEHDFVKNNWVSLFDFQTEVHLNKEDTEIFDIWFSANVLIELLKEETFNLTPWKKWINIYEKFQNRPKSLKCKATKPKAKRIVRRK